ncbi:c-type cytochrome [Kaarinaea lacus]
MSIKQLCFSVFSISLLLLFSEGTYAIDVEAGRVVSTQCAVCHGSDGEGHGVAKSKISGMDVGEFKKLINLYKNGERRNYMMERYTKNLSEADIENLAAYYASR